MAVLNRGGLQVTDIVTSTSHTTHTRVMSYGTRSAFQVSQPGDRHSHSTSHTTHTRVMSYGTRIAFTSANQVTNTAQVVLSGQPTLPRRVHGCANEMDYQVTDIVTSTSHTTHTRVMSYGTRNAFRSANPPSKNAWLCNLISSRWTIR